MAIDLDVPDWLKDYVQLCAERLNLVSEWAITVRLARVVNADVDTMAACHQSPWLNSAVLEFRADVEDTEYWRKTAIHELLHVKHSRIDDYLNQVAFEAIPAPLAATVARGGYRQHYESYTEDLAWCLFRLWRSEDERAESTDRNAPPMTAEEHAANIKALDAGAGIPA